MASTRSRAGFAGARSLGGGSEVGRSAPPSRLGPIISPARGRLELRSRTPFMGPGRCNPTCRDLGDGHDEQEMCRSAQRVGGLSDGLQESRRSGIPRPFHRDRGLYGEPITYPTLKKIPVRSYRREKRTFSSTDCAVVEGEVGAGQRRLLRFTAGFPNVGPGDLIIGNPFDHPELYDFTTCHGHPHFKEYADYRLWTTQGYSDWRALRDGNPDAVPSEILGARPDLAAQMMAGRKEGFCAIDFTPYSSTAGPAKYTSCSTNQGISAGWEDVYSLRLDGQWIETA